jgi:hypothetical protein
LTNEQQFLQSQLEQIKGSNPSLHDSIILEVNAGLNSERLSRVKRIFSSYAQYFEMIEGLRSELNRNLDFASIDDRILIGIRQADIVTTREGERSAWQFSGVIYLVVQMRIRILAWVSKRICEVAAGGLVILLMWLTPVFSGWMCSAPDCESTLPFIVKIQDSFVFAGLFTLVSLYVFSTILVSFFARKLRRAVRLALSSEIFGIHFVVLTIGHYYRLVTELIFSEIA